MLYFVCDADSDDSVDLSDELIIVVADSTFEAIGFWREAFGRDPDDWPHLVFAVTLPSKGAVAWHTDACRVIWRAPRDRRFRAP